MLSALSWHQEMENQMRLQWSTRKFRYQLISILLSLAVSSNCITLVAYPFGLRTLPGDALTSHFPKEASGDGKASAEKENSDLSKSKRGSPSEARVDRNFGKLPLRFEANSVQASRGVQFLSRGNGYSLFLTSHDVVLRMRNGKGSVNDKRSSSNQRQEKLISSLRMKLQNASGNSKVVGLDELPGKSNYFIGNDPKKWRTDVSQFAKVKYEEVYSGIDMVFYGTNQLEYDFVVAPRADANVIRLKFEGPQKQYIDDRGDLVLAIDGGEVRSQKPVVYQVQGEQRQEIDGHYVLTGKNEVAFKLGAYDHTKPLIIDPVLMYSTFLGASQTDYGNDIAVDADGNTYVTGETLSEDFPIVNAFQPILAGSTSGGSYSTDVFVTKFNPEGTQLLYSTFLGGHTTSLGGGEDRGKSIAVDSSGSAYITGETGSPNFPISNPFRSTWGGAFVTKLSPTGNALIYSSNLDAYDTTGIAVDGSGSAYVVGHHGGAGEYQPVNAIQQSFGGGYADALIAKVSSSGSSLLFYTFLGGDGDDRALDIALDNDSNIYVTGFTTSTNLAVTNAFQSSFAGTGTCGLSPNLHSCSDAFVVKLNAAGNSLIYFTYLGGSSDDKGSGVQVDSAGHAFVAGWTSSTNFPTTAGAFQTSFGGENAASGYFGDAFITKLDVAGNALVYSTYLGGNSEDQANALAIDSAGNAYLTGVTRSENFPNVNALWATSGFAPYGDVFVTKLNSLGNGLAYSTRLGGATWDEGNGIAVDASDTAYIIGTTSSSDFPVVSAYQSSFINFYEAFVAKILSGDGYTISGRITDSGGNSVNAVTMTLNGSRTLTTQTDTNGFYAFTYLKPGETGTITPTKNLFIFSPLNLTFSNLAENQTADFTATTSSTTYSIGGRVTDSGGVGTSGITMTLGGSLSNVTQTDANGNYSFTQLVGSGNYTVTPSKTGYNLTYTFTPPSRSYANLSANQVADFSFITSTSLSVNAIADAYVQDGTLANTNFGNVTPLLVKSDNQSGQRRDIYFKYDLGAVTRSITNAKLRIYAGLSASGSINTSAYSVSDTLWTEGGITWNNKPARSGTALTGATVAVTSTTYASYDIDITSYVVGERAAGRDIFSVALHDPSNSTPYILLNSREASTNKPYSYTHLRAHETSAPLV
jgi:hypothetical protein